MAVRTNGTLTYLLGDHLGSTTLAVTAQGTLASEQRYAAFGQTRYAMGDLPTTYEYTGQRNEALIGLYFYRARWYDPALGRFTQADTLIPEPGNPLAWDRYAYGLDNPIKYTDPSGHYVFEEYPDDMIVGDDPQVRSVDWRRHPEVKLKSPSDAVIASTLAGSLIAVPVGAAVGSFVLADALAVGLGSITAQGFTALSWQAARLCSQSRLCWAAIGAGGGQGIPQSAGVRGGAGPVRLGQVGEAHARRGLEAMGEVVLQPQPRMGHARPDFLTSNFVVEVKNTGVVNLSSRFMDQAARNSLAANTSGRQLAYVFTGTQLPDYVVSYLKRYYDAAVFWWPISR